MHRLCRALMATLAAFLGLTCSASAQVLARHQHPFPAAPQLSDNNSPSLTVEDAGTARFVPPLGSQPGFLRLPDGQTYRLVQEAPGAGAATTSMGQGGPSAGTAGQGGGEEGGPDAGTDPSKAKRRFILYHEFYNIQGSGFNFNTTTANVTLPILGGGGTFGLNVPFTYAELPRANPFGLGDIYGRLILLPTTWEGFKEHCDWPFPRIIPVFGTDIYFPTADSTLALNPFAARITTVSLGTSKYRLAPLAGFVWKATERWTVIPIYFHDLSVAGDQRADSINQGKFRLFIQYQDPGGWYTKPEFQLVTDYHDHNRTELYIAPEVGKVLKGGTTFYVKPGYGFFRDDHNRNWGIEVGMRTTF